MKKAITKIFILSLSLLIVLSLMTTWTILSIKDKNNNGNEVIELNSLEKYVNDIINDSTYDDYLIADGILEKNTNYVSFDKDGVPTFSTIPNMMSVSNIDDLTEDGIVENKIIILNNEIGDLEIHENIYISNSFIYAPNCNISLGKKNIWIDNSYVNLKIEPFIRDDSSVIVNNSFVYIDLMNNYWDKSNWQIINSLVWYDNSIIDHKRGDGIINITNEDLIINNCFWD